MPKLDLLPGRQKDFSSKKYWKNFFELRTTAFEWYGDYSDLDSIVEPVLGNYSARVLIVGCGNSSFSAELYDRGFPNILNVDFEKSVIAEMSRKHIRSRPLMKWRVMDMMDMKNLNNASFDAIIDKGAIDALMSEDSLEARNSGKRYLSEVLRLLRPGGNFIVVTLAQEFIAQVLLSELCHWMLRLYNVNSARKSPYLPFCIVANRPHDKDLTSSSARTLTLKVCDSISDNEGQILKSEIKIMEHIYLAQASHRRRYDLSKFEPGRFEELNLWTNQIESIHPRYTLIFADVLEDNNVNAISCAVVLIPRGREHEYMFCAPEGLRDLAKQTGVQRLVAVRCNRGHHFTDIESVRAEITPALSTFVSTDNSNSNIPIMTVSEDAGLGIPPKIVEEGHSDLSGHYFIEEIEHLDDGNIQSVRRRLVFSSSPNVIQTEIKFAKNFDGTLKYDYSYMCFDYHRSMVAGLLLSPVFRCFEEYTSTSHETNALVIGLGGGALPICLNRFYPNLSLTVCELDPIVLDIAERWFQFQQGPEFRTSTVIEDGLLYVRSHFNVEESCKEKFAAIFIDVDCKDSGVGMSCPPQEFVECSFLSMIRELLVEHGVLALNLAARSKYLYQQVLKNVFSAFASDMNEVFVLHPSEEDLNVVVFAVRGQKCCANLSELPFNVRKLANKIQSCTENETDEMVSIVAGMDRVFSVE